MAINDIDSTFLTVNGVKLDVMARYGENGVYI